MKKKNSKITCLHIKISIEWIQTWILINFNLSQPCYINRTNDRRYFVCSVIVGLVIWPLCQLSLHLLTTSSNFSQSLTLCKCLALKWQLGYWEHRLNQDLCLLHILLIVYMVISKFRERKQTCWWVWNCVKCKRMYVKKCSDSHAILSPTSQWSLHQHERYTVEQTTYSIDKD